MRSSWAVSHVAPGEFRLRFCYRKRGRLRFLSHLEVVHTVERGARRAALPYAVTKGFSPHMKVAFGPALPVGTAGQREYFDVWLTRYVPADEMLGQLAGAMPEDLAPHEAVYVAAGLPSLSAACTIAVYEVSVEGEELDSGTLAEALSGLIRTGELEVRHKGKDKIFDLSRSLSKEPRVRSSNGGVTVDVSIRIGEHGSLRPEALVNAALLGMNASGAVLTVTRMDTLIETEEGVARPV